MIFQNKFQITSFFLILFASSIIRLYQLGNVPNGLTVDEADMGYNAYSILQTKKDVYGKKLPLFFQSLDDYKAGFGIYAAIPSIGLAGLNDFSIRLVPAILGSLTPSLVFILMFLLYPRRRVLAYTCAILTCLAPWNIGISRVNLPYIELIFFYLLFFITFLYSLSREKYRPLSFIILGFTLYVYYAAVIYLPVILIIIFLIYRKDLFRASEDHGFQSWVKPQIIPRSENQRTTGYARGNLFLNIKLTFISTLLLIVVSTPAVLHYFNSTSRTRLNAISVLTPDVTLPLSIAEIEDDQKRGYPLTSIIHNRRFVYANTMLDNYFDYFNIDYLFVNSHNIRYFYVNYTGLFYLIEIPIFLIGAFILIRRRGPSDVLILSLLLIGPLPAVITLGSPFPHRGILLLPAIQIISAIGFIEASKQLKKSYKKPVLTSIIFLYLIHVVFFLHQYFIHSPKEFSTEDNNGAWFSTVRDAIPQVEKQKTKYGKVIFSWAKGKLVPPVYFLFYRQIDPKILQTKASGWKNEPPSYRQLYGQIENIEFRPINWAADKNLQKTLLVGYPSEFPKDVQIIDRTYLPNGGTHFIFVETE